MSATACTNCALTRPEHTLESGVMFLSGVLRRGWARVRQWAERISSPASRGEVDRALTDFDTHREDDAARARRAAERAVHGHESEAYRLAEPAFLSPTVQYASDEVYTGPNCVLKGMMALKALRGVWAPSSDVQGTGSKRADGALRSPVLG